VSSVHFLSADFDRPEFSHGPCCVINGRSHPLLRVDPSGSFFCGFPFCCVAVSAPTLFHFSSLLLAVVDGACDVETLQVENSALGFESAEWITTLVKRQEDDPPATCGPMSFVVARFFSEGLRGEAHTRPPQ